MANNIMDSRLNGRLIYSALLLSDNQKASGTKVLADDKGGNWQRNTPGELARISVIKTGDRSYCLIGEWDKMSGIVASRPDMIKSLDKQRDMLEDLGGGLGVTDPVSGEAVVEVDAGK